ncbi:MAG TPA: aminotransferase class IV [Brumimicrobium sp.]|nr:aminotransferase class IV [Brumimicrobium sp.]
MKKLFVNNNGTVIENNGPTIEAGNRGHLYGDGLFESIRIYNGKPINVDAHIARLLEGMSILKMRVPSFYTTEFFTEKITELAEKSEVTAGGRARLSIDRTSGGTYMPESNETNFFIEIYGLEHNDFKLNEKGLELDIYMRMKKEKNIFSNFKTKNGLLYVMAAIEAKEKNLDDILLMNSDGKLIETTSSNIFMVSNGILYTPSLDEGCVGGTMRMRIINLALNNNIRIYESPITTQNLFLADELFITNAISGVKWVGGFRTKRFTNIIAHQIVDLLNQ